MLTQYGNRASWRTDHELELSAILKALPLDELHMARRMIRLELTRREQEGDQHVISEAERALFRV
jgi:hypothetical protein